MKTSDRMYERYKNFDVSKAKPISVFPKLVRHQLRQLHKLNVEIDVDLVKWLSEEVPPDQYAHVMNSALRQFMKRKAA